MNSCTVLYMVCCRCNKGLGSKDGKGISGVSHGYCAECLKKEYLTIDKIKQERKQYENQIN